MANILVAEDDEGIAESIRTMLEFEAHTVRVFNNGKAADEALSTGDDFDVLLLDWDMPGMTGEQICRRYREDGGLGTVIMLTGKTDIQFKESAFELGADDYLTKPFSLRELAARIKAALRRTTQVKESVQSQEAPQLLDRTETNDPYIGTIFANKYKINELIGEGGHGVVYSGLHIGLNRQIAVKLLHSYLISRTDPRVRFQREAHALSNLQHPNIVQVFDFGIHQGQPYMVLEFVEGTPLSETLEKTGALPLADALPVLMQLCDAMQYAHDNALIHRDLKPANVILTKGKEGQLVKLLDLGLVKDLQESDSKLTRSGFAMGTPYYLSPEICRGLPPNFQSDIYSMGCLMYHTFSGKVPFEGTDPMEVLKKHLVEPPPPFAKLINDRWKAGKVERIVLQALEKDPAKRQASFALLKKQLKGC